MRRIVVDVDAGVDDYVALLIFLHADKLGDVKIEGIICTNGNTTRENVVRNVIRLLELVGRTDIPVYRGAKEQFILHRKPFIIHEKPLYLHHGQDGFGDIEHETEPDVSIVKDTPASVALRDLILSAPKEISVICLGPLTTLALTLKLFTEIADQIKDVWIMGGNIKGIGNITSAAEFNFYMDPEAVHIALECLKCEIYILPWEPCRADLKNKIPKEWLYGKFARDKPYLELLARGERGIERHAKSDDWAPCDGLLAFCFINPKKHITKHSKHNATIELYASHTRGQMVLDHRKKKEENVTIIEDMDIELFKELLLKIKNEL